MATVAIVGGGVIGCSVAERLSRDGHRVRLWERESLGSQASGAAAGLLAPYSEGEAMGERSLRLFPELVARLERTTGIAVEYREGESLSPALTAAEERLLRRSKGRWLEAAEALAAEPGLNPQLRGAVIFPEAQITPARLVAALARTAAAQGAEIHEGAPVAALVARSGRLGGVRVPEGVVGADWVVLAAGPWSPALASPLGLALDVRPNRGQLVSLRPARAPLRRVLTWRGSYLVPKPDGGLVAGSTEEEAGFDARPTAAGVHALLEFAVRACPALAGAPVERLWAALRPATPDGRPLIGRAPGLPNLILATGHNRNGILLAPLTAELVAEAIA